MKDDVDWACLIQRMWYRGTLRPRRCAAEVESIRERNLEAHRRSREFQVRFAQFE